MPVANTSFSYDTDGDRDIHLVLSGLTRRDRSAYLRRVIRFFEANKDRLDTDLINDRLERIEAALREVGDKLDRGVIALDGREEESGYLLSVIDQLNDFE